jgi:uncharacterized protein YjbI with pentapeptide repeats
MEARGRARATVTRRLCTIAGLYRYAVQEELLDHSPAAHVRRPRLDYESHATALDRNELGAILVAAGLGPSAEHALISLLALNGLRVSEATGADIEHMGTERGHRTLVITSKGGKVVTIPLAPPVLRLIAAHLRDESPVTWQGCDLDFTGAVLDGADFRRARFTGGEIVFASAVFAAHGHDDFVLDEAEFAAESSVYFRLAEFRGCPVRFHRTRFSGGWVTFDKARFTDAQVSFRGAAFTAGEVRFDGAELDAGLVDFTDAMFTGTSVNFGESSELSLNGTPLPAARFNGATVDFSHVADFTCPPRFNLGTAPPGLRLPLATDVADLP